MLVQKAIVTQTFDNSVEVEYQVSSSCSGCVSEDNCGVGTVAKAFTGKTNKVSIETSLILSKGQHVLIETLEANILLTSAVTYLFPLLGLLLFSVAAQEALNPQTGIGQLLPIIIGISGGVIAQRLGKLWLKRNINAQPIIVISQAQY